MKQRHFFIFLAPALLFFTLVMIIPFGIGTYYSFTDWSGALKTPEFVGLTNYKEIFTDMKFLYSLMITIVFSLLSVISVNIVAFSLATLVTQKLPLENFARAAFFLPNLIGGLILGYIWQFIFNQVVPEIFDVVSPLANDKMALLTIVLVLTWQYAGYIMMIYVTAILNIPADVIEAAKIDGAKSWSMLFYIKLPMLASALTITLFLTLVNSFKQFDVIFSLTNGGPSTTFRGESLNGTETLAMHIYKVAFEQNNLARAQAQAVVFFIMLTIIAIVQVYLNKRKEIEA